MSWTLRFGCNLRSRLLRTRRLLQRFLSDSSSDPPVTDAVHPLPAISIEAEGARKVKLNDFVSAKTSVKDPEIAKFASMSQTWWDAEGPFKPLHDMNPTRLAFIRSTLCCYFGRDPLSSRPLEGLRIADVGCGGGILSEPLARMGATVTGVDAVEKNIKIARIHADMDQVTSNIDYICATAEDLVEQNREFDAVISLEVVEHVANPLEFCQSLAALTVPNGATIVSTVNRSVRGYAATIILAEYILQWLPKGTHQWSSFITPEEMVLMLQRASVNVKEMAGFVYNPLTQKWLLSADISDDNLVVLLINDYVLHGPGVVLLGQYIMLLPYMWSFGNKYSISINKVKFVI